MLRCSCCHFEILFEVGCARVGGPTGILKMLIGVPKEIKNHEYRVGMTPLSVREAVRHGHKVLVEASAGLGIGVSDEDYKTAGAQIAAEPDEIFARADMIVKVKEPQAVERRMLREGQI